MDLPWLSMALNSVAGSFLLVYKAPNYSISASVVKTFLVLEIIHILLGLLWKVVLYPKLFSPLRHLPQPKVRLLSHSTKSLAKNVLQDGSFFNGQFKRILAEPSGNPHREWINSIPNDGLIYYTNLLNAGRLFITNPHALSEVLTTKVSRSTNEPI